MWRAGGIFISGVVCMYVLIDSFPRLSRVESRMTVFPRSTPSFFFLVFDIVIYSSNYSFALSDCRSWPAVGRLFGKHQASPMSAPGAAIDVLFIHR